MNNSLNMLPMHIFVPRRRCSVACLDAFRQIKDNFLVFPAAATDILLRTLCILMMYSPACGNMLGILSCIFLLFTAYYPAAARDVRDRIRVTDMPFFTRLPRAVISRRVARAATFCSLLLPLLFVFAIGVMIVGTPFILMQSLLPAILRADDV